MKPLRKPSCPLLQDERGTMSIELVMILALVSLPLALLLINFATETVEWVQDRAPAIFDEADSLIDG